MARAIRANQAMIYFSTGEWADALRLADAFIAEVEAGAASVHVGGSLFARGSIRLARGDIDGALADIGRCLEGNRAVGHLGFIAGSLGLLAFALLVAGLVDEAAEAANELLRLAAEVEDLTVLAEPILNAALIELGRAGELRTLLERQPATVWIVAARHAVDGEFEAAAEVYARAGLRPAEAWARLRAAERLVAEARRDEADAQLQKALAFYRSVGARQYAREAEALLAGAV
jgi:tetratricopeptide (TPR) repeat protein